MATSDDLWTWTSTRTTPCSPPTAAGTTPSRPGSERCRRLPDLMVVKHPSRPGWFGSSRPAPGSRSTEELPRGAVFGGAYSEDLVHWEQTGPGLPLGARRLLDRRDAGSVRARRTLVPHLPGGQRVREPGRPRRARAPCGTRYAVADRIEGPYQEPRRQHPAGVPGVQRDQLPDGACSGTGCTSPTPPANASWRTRPSRRSASSACPRSCGWSTGSPALLAADRAGAGHGDPDRARPRTRAGRAPRDAPVPRTVDPGVGTLGRLDRHRLGPAQLRADGQRPDRERHRASRGRRGRRAAGAAGGQPRVVALLDAERQQVACARCRGSRWSTPARGRSSAGRDYSGPSRSATASSSRCSSTTSWSSRRSGTDRGRGDVGLLVNRGRGGVPRPRAAVPRLIRAPHWARRARPLAGDPVGAEPAGNYRGRDARPSPRPARALPPRSRRRARPSSTRQHAPTVGGAEEAAEARFPSASGRGTSEGSGRSRPTARR